jgi:DNA-binding NtrC family response regulator
MRAQKETKENAKNRPAMHVLVVDGDRSVRSLVRDALRGDGFDVTVAPDCETAIEVGRRQPFDLVFCDIQAGKRSGLDVLRAFKEELQPETDIILMTGQASLESALEAVRGGARDYIVKPFTGEELAALARTAVGRRRGARASSSTSGRVGEYADYLGRSTAMTEVFKTIERVAANDLPILLWGESGTGKEVTARAIHAASPRGPWPFFTVNCGALTETLLEAELFGCAKGAFPGAVANRPGLFELANGGTVLLKAIAETSLAFQAKLLDALQNNEITRVGSESAIRINVRVLASTTRDPEMAVATGVVRDDLLYRLNMISFRLPPLRERGGDIDLLANAFLNRYRSPESTARRIAPEALQRLRVYSWPGNVRELRQTLQRLAILAPNATIRVADLPEKIRNAAGDLDELLTEMPGQDVGPALKETARAAEDGQAKPTDPEHAWFPLVELEKRYLMRVLYHTRGNKKRAAEIIGVDRKTLSRMVERHDINVARIKRDVRGLR